MLREEDIAIELKCQQYAGYHKKMDGTAAGLVGDPCPAGGLLRRQDAGLRKRSRKPSARSRVNGFAAPSAPLTARQFPAILYPRGGGQATACNIDFALFYANEAFTQNLKKSLLMPPIQFQPERSRALTTRSRSQNAWPMVTGITISSSPSLDSYLFLPNFP